jgi:hypothetical protein
METKVSGFRFSINNTVLLKSQGYADDLLYFCDSDEEIRIIAACLHLVRSKLYLSANASKCGILESWSSDRGPVYIGPPEEGNKVPFVKEYKYLGHVIHKDMTVKDCRRTQILDSLQTKELKIY